MKRRRDVYSTQSHYEVGYTRGIRDSSPKRRRLTGQFIMRRRQPRRINGLPARMQGDWGYYPRAWAGRRRGANAKASQALRMIRKMKSQQEVKILNSNTETMQIPDTGQWILEMFGPFCVQGDNINERIGRNITVKNLAIKLVIKLTAAETTGTTVRLIIGYDRRCAGAVSTPAMFMATDDEINSCYNYDNQYKGRFQILADKRVKFGSNQMHQPYQFFFKGPMQIEYNLVDGGTIADVERGAFFVAAMAESNDTAINVRYSYIFRFTDD